MPKWINITKALKLPITTTEPLGIYVNVDSITSVHFYKDHEKEVYGICVWVGDELNPYIAEYVDKAQYQSAQGLLMHQLQNQASDTVKTEGEKPCSEKPTIPTKTTKVRRKRKSKREKVSLVMKRPRGRPKSK